MQLKRWSTLACLLACSLLISCGIKRASNVARNLPLQNLMSIMDPGQVSTSPLILTPPHTTFILPRRTLCDQLAQLGEFVNSAHSKCYDCLQCIPS